MSTSSNSNEISIHDLPRVGLDLRIETPENVVLSYQLAGPAIRSAAYLLDTLFRAVILLVIGVTLTCSGIIFTSLGSGIWLLLMFATEWAYFLICEAIFNGKTLGKHVFGLRVIHERGYPVGVWGSVSRNLLRAVDAMPLYGIAFISMVISPRFQRLGDLLAGTVVVSDRFVSAPREPVILERIQPLSRQELGSYRPGDDTLALIDRFLGRRNALTHGRGHALASVLATALAERLDFRGDPNLVRKYPMAFLARVYVTFLRTQDDIEDEEQESASRRFVGASR